MMTSLWEQVLTRFQERLSPQSYSVFVEPVRCVGFESDCLTLAAPSRFLMDWFSQHYLGDAIRELSELCDRPLRIDMVVEPGSEQERATQEAAAPEPPKKPRPAKRAKSEMPTVVPAPQGLLPRYRFESFIFGAGNELAASAAKAASERPGQRYNPLFIYGAPGLGKTHLLHAVGHELYRRHPHTRIMYIGAEQFLIDFVRAARTNEFEAFRKRFREDCDCLLMDDIQFLAKREQTMQEFFHLFTALHTAGKQIIVTADRCPDEMAGMEERLISRLNWGLVTDVQSPDTETRLAIVAHLAQRERVSMSHRAMVALAERVVNNVRELEGAFLRVVACAELRGISIDEQFVRAEIERHTGHEAAALTVETIQKAVSNYYSVRMSDLKGQKRHRSIARPRMLAMYLSRELTGASFPEIGHQFGGKDHTTVMSACRRIRSLASEDQDLRSAVESLTSQLQAQVA